MPHLAPRRALLRRRSTVLAAVAVLGVVLAGCSTAVAGTAAPVAGTAAPATAISGGAVLDPSPAEIPAGLEKFYTQKLAWGSCIDYAQTSLDKQTYATPGLLCARLQVPVSYPDPTGKTATVGVMKAPSTGTDPMGAVVFNPGGPGASGMSTIGQFAGYGIGADLREHFDLVGFDPRGTGASRPVISCHTDAQWDAERASNLRTATAAGVAKINAQVERVAQSCIATTGKAEGIDGAAFLASVGDRDVAKDMDVLRAALGEQKLTYVGYSAGTLLGTLYAEEFPQNVRGMILDGAVDPAQNPTDDVVDQGKSFQQAFDAFAKWCAGQQQCALGTDPSAATGAFQKLTRPLLETPLKLADGRVLTYQDAITGTSEAMYSDSERPTLAKGLQQLTKGDGTGLMQLADAYDDRDSAGHYSNLIDAFNVITCLNNPRVSAAEELKLNTAYVKAAPFTDSGDPPTATKQLCDYLPAPTLQPHTPNVPGLAKVLVISTTGDPATPYQAGVNLAKDLGAALLTVDGSRHTEYLGAGVKCADDIGNAYLIDLKIPAAGVKCS
ncbi:MAG: alpha/beta hydrolase [Actinomycetota bacterium]|nr:alpha/beta hydrolase [Actinomycetota bacterium]